MIYQEDTVMTKQEQGESIEHGYTTTNGYLLPGKISPVASVNKNSIDKFLHSGCGDLYCLGAYNNNCLSTNYKKECLLLLLR